MKPKDEKDYYRIGRWMAGKELVLRLGIGVFILSILVIWMAFPVTFPGKQEGYPVYRYDSILLRFRSGKAGILAESGYRAYTGQVKKGAAQGKGTLYRKNGTMVYKGAFEASLYHGKGTLYRDSGTKVYQGEFDRGKRQGEGKLYNESETLIYEGNFKNDEIIYEEFIGKKTEETAGMYSGKISVWTYEEEMCGIMEEIDAIYCAASAGDSMEGGYEVAKVYVLEGGEDLPDGEEADLVYDGTSRIKFPEAAAMKTLKEEKGLKGKIPDIRLDAVLSDVSQVSSYEETFEIYLRTYVKEDFRYTFYSRDKKSPFLFYSIESK